MRVISLLEAFHTLPAHFGPALVDDSARLSIGTRQDTRVFRVGMFWTAPWASSPRPFLPTAPTSPQMPASLTGLHVQRCLHEPISRGRAGFSLSPAAGTLAPARAETALASPAPYNAAATCYGVFFSLVLD